ncbi:MAG: DUF448 domain-containing protein [Candidatus Sericytochromatia bacterium]|nr:DUF448 domain-containing protein [Candidatus Sericytochromatia bacterium]
MRSELRRCLVCRCLNHRHLLFRLQKQGQGPVWVRSAHAGAASVYLCMHSGCLDRLQKRRLLQKRWGEIPDDVIRVLCANLRQALPSDKHG